MGCSKSISEMKGFSYFRKQEKFPINYLTLHLNQLEKEEEEKEENYSRRNKDQTINK